MRHHLARFWQRRFTVTVAAILFDDSKRILLLERQHMNLYPHMILGEIEKRRSSFPDLAHVDEIWIIETIFYGTAFGGTYLRFEQYENATKIRSFVFNDGKLFGAY